MIGRLCMREISGEAVTQPKDPYTHNGRFLVRRHVDDMLPSQLGDLAIS